MSDWLVDTFGIDAGFARGLQFVIALVIVFVLFAILVFALRRLNGGGIKGGGRNRQPRLAVMDHAQVDARRRLVLIRRDNVEHLLLIGGPTDVVVEQAITRGVAVGAQPRATYGMQPLAKAEPGGGGGGNMGAAVAATGALAAGTIAATAEEAKAEPERPYAVAPTPEPKVSAPVEQPAMPEPVEALLEPEEPALAEIAADDGDLKDDDVLGALGQEPAREPLRRNKFRPGRAEAGGARKPLGEGLLARRRNKAAAKAEEDAAAARTETTPSIDEMPEPAIAEPTVSEPKVSEPVMQTRAEPMVDVSRTEKKAEPVRPFGRPSRGPAAGLFGRERNKESGERRSLSSLVAAASGAGASVLGKRGADKTEAEPEEAVTAPEPPVVETPAPIPPVSAPPVAEPPISTVTVSAPQVEAPSVDAGSLADVTPEPAKPQAGGEPAWLRDLQSGLDKELSAPQPASPRPAREARVEPSFLSRKDESGDKAAESKSPTDDAMKAEAPESSPAASEDAAAPKATKDELEAAIAGAFDLDMAAPEPEAEGPAANEETPAVTAAEDEAAAEAPVVGAPPSPEPSASTAPDVAPPVEPQKKSNADEIEEEMAKLLSELTGKSS